MPYNYRERFNELGLGAFWPSWPPQMPFVDFHKMNLDWILEAMRAVLDQMKYYFIDGGSKETIEEVMEEHPEWWPRVMDGAITSAQINNEFLKEIRNAYVTPEMFGAVGDGTTDDTAAIQAAIDYGFDNNKPVLFDAKTYIIKKPILYWCPYNRETTNYKTALIGRGIGNTVISKDGGATSGLDHQNVDAIIQVVDARFRDPSYTIDSYSDSNTTRPFIHGFSLRNTNADQTLPTTSWGIYGLGWFFGTFSEISITGCASGIGCQQWSCYTNFINVEVRFAEIGFNFGLSANGSGAQTTMYFIACHTDGCIVRGYELTAKCTLVGCSNDGGTGTFIHCAGSPGLPDRQGINATLLDCHSESLTANGLVDIVDGIVNVIGGYYELPTNTSTLFKAARRSKINIEGVEFVNRNSTVSLTSKLYETLALGTVKFNNCKINNAFFSTPQPLKNKTLTCFDCGNNNLSIATTNADISVTEDTTVDISINASGERFVYIYLGEINLAEFSVVKMLLNSSFVSGFCECSLRIADSITSDGRPSGTITRQPMAFNSAYNAVEFNRTNFPTVTVAYETIGSKLNSNDKKHLFIQFYTSNAELTASIYKIWFE